MRFPVRTRLLVLAALLACVPVRSAPDRDAVHWLPVQDVASGGGTKGPWRQNDSQYDYVDDGTLAFLPGGGLAVAWVDQRRKEVLLQVFTSDGRGHGAAVDVSRNPDTFSWMPRIAAGGPDTLHVLWQEIVFSGGSHGGEILYARSLDGGRSFSQPMNLSNSPGGDGKGRLDRDIWSNGSLDLAVGANGKVYAAWTDYDGALWLARSHDGGRGFTPPQRIAGDNALPARGPALALDTGGTLYLAWAVGEDPDADIRVSSSPDRGASFSPPVLVGAKGARADAPRLAFDGGGRLHLVYMEGTGKQPAAIRHVRSEGPALAFGTPRTLSAHGEAAMAPQLAADAQGRVHVVWESAQGLRYTRVADTIVPVTVPHGRPGAGARQGSQQGLLGRKLAAGDGTVALVNSSLAAGHGSRVWLMRGRLPES